MSYQAVKKSTVLTKVFVANHPQHTLTVLYGKILRALQNMPEDAAYRKYTEEIITHRASIVKDAASPEEIEKKIDCGLVEELIIQAENELTLARNFANSKPWEPLMYPPPQGQWTWPPTK